MLDCPRLAIRYKSSLTYIQHITGEQGYVGLSYAVNTDNSYLTYIQHISREQEDVGLS